MPRYKENGTLEGKLNKNSDLVDKNSNKKETNNELYRAETISSASEKNTKNLNSDSKNNNPNTIKSDKMSSSVSTSLTQNKFSVTRSGLFVSKKEVFDSQSSIISISENDFKEVKEDKVLEEICQNFLTLDSLIQATNSNFTIVSFDDGVNWQYGADYCSSFISSNLASIHSYQEQLSFIKLRVRKKQ